MLSGNGDALSAVLNFSVPEALLTERMLGRAQAEGRADDRPETIRERLRVYREKTEPLVGFYRDRDLLTEIDGVGSCRRWPGGSTRRSRRPAGSVRVQVRGAARDHDPKRTGARQARGGLAHRPRDARHRREGRRPRRDDGGARPDRRDRDQEAGRAAGLRGLSRVPEDPLHVGQRRGRARHPRAADPRRGRRRRHRLRRGRRRLLRRRGADGSGRQGRRREDAGSSR